MRCSFGTVFGVSYIAIVDNGRQIRTDQSDCYKRKTFGDSRLQDK